MAKGGRERDRERERVAKSRSQTCKCEKGGLRLTCMAEPSSLLKTGVVGDWCRLTGLYAIVIGLQATLVKFFATGIQSATIEYGVNACKESW